MEYDKVKDILDRECYENWHAKRCQERESYLTYIHTPCYLCDKNYLLAQEIIDAVQLVSRPEEV